MNSPAMRIMVSAALVALLSCKDTPTTPAPSAGGFEASSSTCGSPALGKRSADSVLTYVFTDRLVIDFSVAANCCPDSGRFVITSQVGLDTIDIMVADTAERRCRCICTYYVHTEFTGLREDQYVVRCRLSATQGTGDIIHLVTVTRTVTAVRRPSADTPFPDV